MKFWKVINFIVLGIQATICALGTFYMHISFGWGLGDLLWYALMYILLAVQLILILLGKNRSERFHLFVSLIFFVIVVFIGLKATIWRGAEYPWNGKIFYEGSDPATVTSSFGGNSTVAEGLPKPGLQTALGILPPFLDRTPPPVLCFF